MARVKLTGLDSREYEHPFDRRALEALTGTPGLETLVRKFNEYGLERLFRISFTGSNLKVTPRNFPDLDAMLHELCGILDIARVPDLYIRWDYGVNAFTAGVERPLIVLDSGCIDLLDETELRFVLGHELGHIKSNHVLYHQMAIAIPIIGKIIGSMTLGLGSLIGTGLELALLKWHRMSEFTADRAGCLACQDASAGSRALMKAAGLPAKYHNAAVTAEFEAQARAFDDLDDSTLDLVLKWLTSAGMSHPWTVMRGSEFLKWVDAGELNKILGRTRFATMTPPPLPPPLPQ